MGEFLIPGIEEIQVMDTGQAQKWLETCWVKVLEEGDQAPDPEVDRFINSKVLSIRYAVLTQLLGKIADSRRSLMCLQLRSEEPGAWNARSFSTSVIVPWVSKNNDVIGTSKEPYGSKPLRRPNLEQNAKDVQDKSEWNALYNFFAPLDNAGREEIEKAFLRCLSSAARRMAVQQFKYQIPLRISLPNTLDLLESFLSEPSGGFRALAITVALMNVLGKGFSIFSNVKSQGLNEADSASGAPGDIMCFDVDGNMVLAIEVKDRQLTLEDVRSATRKARESDTSLANLLFATTAVSNQESESIERTVNKEFGSGMSIHQSSIIDLVKATFVLLAENWRKKLLEEICRELDDRGDHAHRIKWQNLLSELADREST